MASLALADWQTRLSVRLDELETIHASATGRGPGRRWGTEQFNGQLFVALVGQFQSYTRDLHDEGLDWLRQQSPLARTLADLASRNRRLDRGNPSPAALSEDFARLGLRLQAALRQRSSRNDMRLLRLEKAVHLRNGIAHDDSSELAKAAEGPRAERAVPTLTSYRIHRRALNALAIAVDDVVAEHLGRLASTSRPW
jgi:hypothetical protein